MAQNNNNEINKIEVIREINDRYVVIKYFDAEVIYDKETKFINATKLCQHISKLIKKQKLFKNWLRLKQTRDFILDLIENHNENFVAQKRATTKEDKKDSEINVAQKRATTKEENNEEILKSNNLGYIIKDGYKKHMEIRGTYLHLDLIPQLCNWASKEYAFKISYIINYINGIKVYDSAYSKLKNDELKAKDDELESKTDEIKKLEEEHQKQIKAKDKEIETKENKIKDLKKELKETKKKNEKKTTIIKEKSEKVKELEKKIKDKTEELEKLKETKSEDDIEIKKLKQDIELLKSQLAEALKNNKSILERMDDFIKAGEKEREEHRKKEEEYKKREKEREKQYKEELKKKEEEAKLMTERMDKCLEKLNEMTITYDIIANKLLKSEKDKDKAETEAKEIKKELKGIPEIILIFISEENNKQLYISRIKKDTKSRVIKKLKALKYKVYNKYQTYNSVINYNKAIKEYKEAEFITTKRNYITLKNISLDEFIERIKETI